MSAIINTNMPSLNAQRNLSTSQSALSNALQRLSSGLRINSAKDDAAGLAISDRMTSQIRGLNQAVRNANDGISLSQTAEGAMSQSSTILQRMRELAIQSANASNVSTDRASLNAETQQLLAELQRVAETTQFNGQNILDGTFTSAQFQVGANANQTILASMGNAQTSALGSYQVSGGTAVSGTALSAGQLTVNGVDVGASTSGSAESIAAAINSVASQTGVSATASTSVTSSTAPQNAIIRNQTMLSGDLVINGVNVGSVAGSSSVATQGANVAAAINSVTAQTGVTAVANAGTGALTLSSSTGKTIAITSNNGNDGATRVENATGLEMVDATKVKGIGTLTVANGARQVVTHTATATAAAGNTITIAGKTFTYVAAITDQASQILVDNDSADDQAAEVNTAIAAAIADGSLDNVTLTSTVAAVTTLTAKANVLSTAATDGIMSATASVAGAGAFAQTTAGAGLAAGDTLTLGGITYEFTLPTATAASTTGRVQVKLGTDGASAAADDILTATNLADAISAQYAAGNGTVQFTSRTNGVVTFTNALYGDTDVVAAPTEPVTNGTANALVAASTTAGVSGVYAANTTYGTLALNSASQFSVAGSSPSTAGLSTAQVGLTALNTVNISTVSGANNAISLIDGALTQISTLRGNLGALQNRFDSAVSSLSATAENLTAARSRILDADFAQETANLTRAQILQQAGTAMLAQANQLPNMVLTLLQG
ncbi:MAG: flagellin [Oxalobacter sp.]|nr:MAG: flagellin [Oxalobacter sp.]